MAETGHISVLAAEVLAGLAPKPGGTYVDATFGAGGHCRALLDALDGSGRVLALDRDPDAIIRGEALQKVYPDQLTILHAPFADLGQALTSWGVERVDGILFDLGVSSFQLDQPGRGFSFRFDGPLDMRMDHSRQSGCQTAADLVNTLNDRELADLFFRFGEESRSRKIARAITMDRKKTPFTTTAQLAQLAERVIPNRKRGIHPATKIFQALRIAVNGELDQLQQGLEAAMTALAVGGVLVVISFHSLEDRIVKQSFRMASTQPRVTGPAALLPQTQAAPLPFRQLTRKPIIPTQAEQARNSRSRSAKMRIIQRVAPADQSTVAGGGVL
ncbi:MAG: 16S rRNA (cytosine(1402)-N(4))-methyltransferase RsmH [Magnetococcales bacterium]|nr:16S rRNA (cytosine(1402)-N(4))-methyltransferase RsmH [Magnetococcales bacterium]